MSTHAATAGPSDHSRDLEGREKRALLALGLPTFGLALAITTVSTYLPKVAKEFTGSSTVIGVIIGGEGIMALFLPLLIGAWSDRLRTPIGGRLPFVLAGVPVAATALVLLGLAGSLGTLALFVGLFFAAYFVAYEPYRALYPDLLSDDIAGRAQSTQALWRGAATALALTGGGLLLSIGQVVPFAAAALLLVVAVGVFAAVATKRARSDEGARGNWDLGESLVQMTRLVREHPALRYLLLANSLWELSLAALKTFVILYVTLGLGFGVGTASLIVGGTALFVLAAAGVVGKLGDRFGRARVMEVALWVYGFGLLVPFLTSNPALIVAVLPFVAFGGGTVMTLPYALLMPMMPEDEHGALTGLYSTSRGLGIMLGPLLAGAAIDAFRGSLHGTQGYAAVWLVCSAAIFASLVVLRRMRAHDEDRRALSAD